MKIIDWDTPRNFGVISNNDQCVPIGAVPERGSNIAAIYQGIQIRLRTIDNSNRSAIRAEVLCADSVSDKLPEDLSVGDTVIIDRSLISWIYHDEKT